MSQAGDSEKDLMNVFAKGVEGKILTLRVHKVCYLNFTSNVSW